MRPEPLARLLRFSPGFPKSPTSFPFAIQALFFYLFFKENTLFVTLAASEVITVSYIWADGSLILDLCSLIQNQYVIFHRDSIAMKRSKRKLKLCDKNSMK